MTSEAWGWRGTPHNRQPGGEARARGRNSANKYFLIFLRQASKKHFADVPVQYRFYSVPNNQTFPRNRNQVLM